MKATIVFCFIYFCSFTNAHSDNQLNNMINESLLSYIDRQAGLSGEAANNRENQTIYICMDNYPLNFSFSGEISKKNVRFVSLQNPAMRKAFKRNKVYLFYFTETTLERNQLRITVSSRNVSIPKRNHINVAIVDWGTFVYEFSCDKQEWELKESTFGGV